MSVIESRQLALLLHDYFSIREQQLPIECLADSLDAINSLESLIAIDKDVSHILWRVVPQVVMHKFGLESFKAFRSTHNLNKTFIFVHPAHVECITALRHELEKRWRVTSMESRPLTRKLVSDLYGGYQWHASYAAGCAHRGDYGKPSTFLLLDPMTPEDTNNLTKYKNESRNRLSPKIVIGAAQLQLPMNAIIQAFHCPDAIENVRQMINLGLVHLEDLPA